MKPGQVFHPGRDDDRKDRREASVNKPLPAADDQSSTTATDPNNRNGAERDVSAQAEPPTLVDPPPAVKKEPMPEPDAVVDLPPLVSWEASEYVQHHHSPLWYVILTAITGGLVAVLVLVLKEWLSAVVVVLMIVALLVYAHRSPRVLKYVLNEAGIAIGSKFFPYTDFRSFAVVPTKAFLTIDLDPLKRFMPRLSIFLDKDEAEMISTTLERHLPREDRRPDLMDRLSHALKL